MATSREIRAEIEELEKTVRGNPDDLEMLRMKQEALYWTEGREEDERQRRRGARKLETAGIYRRRRKRRKKC